MNILITGANRGIGLELTKQYSSQGHHVFALCRSTSSDLDRCKNTSVITGVDVTDNDTIIQASKKCPNQIDLLINNAGILKRVSLDTFDEKIIQDQWEINAMGPLRVIKAFQNQLVHGSKLALITSRMGSIKDNDSGSHYGYRMSKAALNMAGKSLSIDLNDLGIAVAIIHPGWVKTDMTGQTGHYTVDIAASQIRDRIDDLNLSNSGSFWHSNGDILPW